MHQGEELVEEEIVVHIEVYEVAEVEEVSEVQEA